MILSICYPAYRSQVNAGHMYQLGSLVAAAHAPYMESLEEIAAAAKGGNKERKRLAGLLAKELAAPSIVHLNVHDSCFLDLARNCLLYDAAYRQEADWALMCDADTFHAGPVPVITMLNTGNQLKAAIIGAPVKLRGQDAYNVQALPSVYMPREEWIDKVMEIERIGTAFMAINCRWLRQSGWSWDYRDPWFTSRFLSPDEMEASNMDRARPMKMSEDYEFCDKIRARGGKVYVDGRLEPVHAGITSETATRCMLRINGVEREDASESAT